MDTAVCSITLAAGMGSRMPHDMRPKPCCKVGPVSVIENALQTYEEAGAARHVVVVGCLADQVMAEVCRTRRDVLFAYQSQPRGTGDAVRCALDLLAAGPRPEHVLISSGDKVVAPQVIRHMVETYSANGWDLCLAAGKVTAEAGGGRIIVRDGRALAIIESPDIRVRQMAAHLRSLPADDSVRTLHDVRALAERYLSSEKLGAFSPALRALLEAPGGDKVPWNRVLEALAGIPDGFELATGRVSTEEAAAAELLNLGIYVGRFEPLLEAVHSLQSDNVQGECYFTDVVELLAAAGRTVGLCYVDDPHDVMGFNTLRELEDVRRIHAVRAQARASYPTLERWANYWRRHEPTGHAVRAVEGLAARIGAERPAVVVLSPGRINLMGRHIDHQGGTCNLMAINREIAMAASPRADDQINLWNAEAGSYRARSFTFRELTADIIWGDWLRTLESQYIQRLSSGRAGDWANYVMGAALRLQHRFKDRPLRGMDAFVSGSIPVGAGLSSSSALVVATAEALGELNALNVRPTELVDLCGEGEWFVGTRGGSADHAAIKFGQEMEVVTVSFFPFQVVGRHPFPDGHSLVVCHSGLSAKKTENARDRFNARVACYHMAREIIRREFPQLAERVRHLRDVNVRNLDLSLPALYAVLKHVPFEVGPDEVAALAEQHPDVAKCVANMDLSGADFPLRDVALYGLAECERAQITGDLLDAGDVNGLGARMNLSHNGDRVALWDPDCTPFAVRATDEHMDTLIARAASLIPLGESGAALWQQPGAYGCSVPKIDGMVDLSLRCPGVLGAQLAGAGLGGCIMILAQNGRAEAVQDALRRHYYEAEGIEPQMFVCRPGRGSRTLTSVGDEG